MTQKPFEELTISDDFMFCKVMEHEPICREFLEMSFSARHPCLSENTTFALRQNIACWQDVRETKQYRVFHMKNSKLKNVQGGTFLSDGIRAATETELCKKLNHSAFFKNEALEPRRVLRVEP